MTLCAADNKKPESFTGKDGAASASVELRKRGTNSPLKEEEHALLLANGFAPTKQVVTQQLFAINPAYAGDAKLLEKVSGALGKIKDLPADFIVQQDEVSKMVVSEENVAEIFAARPKLNKDTFESLVRIVTTQALKPKLEETDFTVIMGEIAKLLTATESEVEEA